MCNSTKQVLLSEIEVEPRIEMHNKSKRGIKMIVYFKTFITILKKTMRVVSERN